MECVGNAHVFIKHLLGLSWWLTVLNDQAVAASFSVLPMENLISLLFLSWVRIYFTGVVKVRLFLG
jgi:hypothetical protein